MKKTYAKPCAFIERFDLAQSIAAGCTALGTFEGSEATFKSLEDGCGFVVGDMPYFQAGVKDCFDVLVDLCYNGPREGHAIFAS